MISYQVIEHGKPLQKVMFETPKPTGTEVLVRVTRSGVCHSDLHIWDGYFDWGGGKKFYVKDRGCIPPFTMGHEPFGIVEAIGPKAKNVKVGQKRIVYPWIGCGKCDICKAGRDNYCVSGAQYLGVTRPGAYSTHVLIPHPKYLVDAAGIDESFAPTLACSALTAYSAIGKLPNLAPRDWVAAMGCGGLRLPAISKPKAKGATKVIGCTVPRPKLAPAGELGPQRTLITGGAVPCRRCS